MILGGVGSVRLAARQTPSNYVHALGASERGISHQGIPILADRHNYLKIAPRLKELGACVCDITGTIEVLSEQYSLVRYDSDKPKFVIRVEELKLHERLIHNPIVTISALFSGACREYEKNYKRDSNVGWSFATFDPTDARGRSVEDATAWLQEYATRHSVLREPPIFCDFDESREHFALPVAFTMKGLFEGTLDAEILHFLIRKYNFNFGINNQYGDVFANISGTTIINRSKARIIEAR